MKVVFYEFLKLDFFYLVLLYVGKFMLVVRMIKWGNWMIKKNIEIINCLLMLYGN